ncbi:MAG: glycosyltransferase, partial [Lentilitoribacter sp.]
PHGFSESVHSLVHNNSQSFYFEQDVGYIGNHSKYKQDFLMQLVERNQDINLRICGANWHANIEGTLLEEKYDPTPRSGLSYSSFIQKSKINIALHFGEGPNGWADQVSTRTFEIPACGGFMLHVDNDEVRDFYSVGDEIDVFTNPEQLCERIGFYLENEKTRIEMSMSAHRRANGAYSYSEIAGRINDFIFKKPVER